MKKKSSANFIRILKSQTFIDLSDLKTGWLHRDTKNEDNLGHRDTENVNKYVGTQGH